MNLTFLESSSGESDESPCEIWKTHPDHPGYEFSNLGQVMSHHKGKYKDKILPGRTERSKHIWVELKTAKPQKRYRARPLHQLILEVFVGPCPTGKQIVRHIDGDERNNRVENLIWGTYQENSFDRHKHNGTSKGGRRSRAIKYTAHCSEVQGPLRNALEVAIVSWRAEILYGVEGEGPFDEF